MGSVARSYMGKGFLIYEEMRKYLTMKEETVSHTGLCNRTVLNSLIFEGNLIFFFISVQWNPVRHDEKQKRSYSKTTSPRANEELDEDEHRAISFRKIYGSKTFFANILPLYIHTV
jgi:hypothetical protein